MQWIRYHTLFRDTPSWTAGRPFTSARGGNQGPLLLLGLGVHQVVPLLLPLEHSTIADRLVTGLFQNDRGTRGPSSAISSGDDESVLWNLADALLELAEGDVDESLHRAELFEFLGFTNV